MFKVESESIKFRSKTESRAPNLYRKDTEPLYHSSMYLLGMENSIPVQISNFLTHQPNETYDNNAYKAIPLLITPDLYV